MLFDCVDQVFGWFGQSDLQVFCLVMLYMEQVDYVGYDYGLELFEYVVVIVEVDIVIGWLLDGLQVCGFVDDINIVVVFDYGMVSVLVGQVIVIEDMVDLVIVWDVIVGQLVGFVLLFGKQCQVEKILLGVYVYYDCWWCEVLLVWWVYGIYLCILLILCQMYEGWDVLICDWIVKCFLGDCGLYGYDNVLFLMWVVFIVCGLLFRQGVVIVLFDNVDVYLLLVCLFDVLVVFNDGDL